MVCGEDCRDDAETGGTNQGSMETIGTIGHFEEILKRMLDFSICVST